MRNRQKRRLRRTPAALLLILSLLTSEVTLTGQVFAAGTGKIPVAVAGGNIYVDPASGAVVSADSSVTEALIPESAGDVTIREIAPEAFLYCTKLTHVVLPKTVEKIGKFAFEGCLELEKIEIENEELKELAISGDKNGGLDDEEEGRSTISWYAFYSVGRAIYGLDLAPSYQKSKYYKNLAGTELTGNYREDVIAVARSQLGYREGFSPDALDGNNRADYEPPEGVTSNMHYEWGHFTEMARYRGIQGTTWCAAFVMWCYAMAGVPDDVVGVGMQVKKHSGQNAANVFYWNDTVYAGKGGKWEIQPGDILHLGKSHYALATGVSVADGWATITYIEGNGNNRNVDEDETMIRCADGVEREGDYALRFVSSPDFTPMVNHTLTFEPNNGSGEISTKQIAERAFFGVLPEPEKEGCDFAGWFTKKEGGEQVLPYSRFTGGSDLTLYAHWNKSPFSDSYKQSRYYKRLKKVDLTGNLRKDVINVAYSQIGYHESDDPDDLGGESEYGEGDYTEYGAFLDTGGSAWCSEFISWCLRMADVPEEIIASGNSANVKKFKAPYITWDDMIYAGGTYRMKRGDIILLDRHDMDPEDGNMIHSAFFYGAKDQGDKVAIRLLEGNTDDMVTTEIIYVDPETGYLLEEPYENGERLRIGCIITPEY